MCGCGLGSFGRRSLLGGNNKSKLFFYVPYFYIGALCLLHENTYKRKWHSQEQTPNQQRRTLTDSSTQCRSCDRFLLIASSLFLLSISVYVNIFTNQTWQLFTRPNASVRHLHPTHPQRMSKQFWLRERTFLLLTAFTILSGLLCQHLPPNSATNVCTTKDTAYLRAYISWNRP